MAPPVESNAGSFSWRKSVALVTARVHGHLAYFFMDYAIVLLSLVVFTLFQELFSLYLLLAAIVVCCVAWMFGSPGSMFAMILVCPVLCILSREVFSLLLFLAALFSWCVVYSFQRELVMGIYRAHLNWLGALTTPLLLLTGFKEMIIVAAVVGSAIVVLHAALRGLD